jgi:hypothetical protein
MSIKANKLSNSENARFWLGAEKDLKKIYKKLSVADEVGDVNEVLMYIAKRAGQTYAAHKITSRCVWKSFWVTEFINICLVHDRFWINNKEAEKGRVLRLLEEVQAENE